MSLAFLDLMGADVPGRSPLADSSLAAGANLAIHNNVEVAVDYGNPAAEGDAMSSRVGLVDCSHLRKYELAGDHGLSLGAAVVNGDSWSCPVSRTRMLVIGEVVDRPDEAIDLTSSLGSVALVGPRAREVVARFCALDLRPDSCPVGAFLPGSIARTPGYVLHSGENRFILLFGAAYGAYFWDVVSDAVAGQGGVPAGLHALKALDA